MFKGGCQNGLVFSLLALFLVSVFLVSCTGGITPTPANGEHEVTEPAPYTTTELAELTSPAIVYIKAYREGIPYSVGSGFIVDPEGLVITNHHVLEGGDQATVDIHGQHYDQVTVLAASREWDLALLRIEDAELPALPLGSGLQSIAVGESVLAVGHPEGLEGTVSTGIVSAVRFDEHMDMELIQTTAPISKGSSGGPLLNMYGEVIGVNTLTYRQGQNLNFAVPVDFIHSLLEDAGPGASVATVFSSQPLPAQAYQHQRGDFAVTLEWEGDFDLDLELWSEDFQYIGDAFLLGESPDITSGEQGAEWFVFQDYPASQYTGEYGLYRDFGQGRYVVSPYFYGPPADQSAEAILTVFFPDGSTHQITQTLEYAPPYDQWFAVLIDVDNTHMEVLDFFDDGTPQGTTYRHQPGELAVVLAWEGDFDLDLEIWSDQLEYLGKAFEFGTSPDITRGNEGEEWFVFRSYPGTGLDFSTGQFVISPYFVGPPTDDVALATLTIIFPDGSHQHLQQELRYLPPYDQWFSVIIDAENQDAEVLDFFAD